MRMRSKYTQISPPTRPCGRHLILRPPCAVELLGTCVVAAPVRLPSFRPRLPGGCHGFCRGSAAAAGHSSPVGSGRPHTGSPGSGSEEGVPCSLPLPEGAGAMAPAALPAAARATVGVPGGFSGQGGGEDTGLHLQAGGGVGHGYTRPGAEEKDNRSLAVPCRISGTPVRERGLAGE